MVTYYPVVDHIPNKKDAQHSDFRGKLTGEFRPPKKGEWYLSGAIPECYRAPNDLTQAFHIIKLVKIERIVTYVEVD